MDLLRWGLPTSLASADKTRIGRGGPWRSRGNFSRYAGNLRRCQIPKTPRGVCGQRTVFARCVHVRGCLARVGGQASTCTLVTVCGRRWPTAARGGARDWSVMRSFVSRAARSLVGGFLPGPAGRAATSGDERSSPRRSSADRAHEGRQGGFWPLSLCASGHVPKTMRCAMTVTLTAAGAPGRCRRRRSAGPTGEKVGARTPRKGVMATTDARRRGPPNEGPRRWCRARITCARRCRRRPCHRRCTC